MTGHTPGASAAPAARPELLKARRVVVKIGTALLTGNTTQVDRRFLLKLCAAVGQLCDQGREVVMVTSGAIGAGCGVLGYATRPPACPNARPAPRRGKWN